DPRPHPSLYWADKEEETDEGLSLRQRFDGPKPATTASVDGSGFIGTFSEGLALSLQEFLNGLWPGCSGDTAQSVLTVLNVLLAYGLWRTATCDDVTRR